MGLWRRSKPAAKAAPPPASEAEAPADEAQGPDAEAAAGAAVAIHTEGEPLQDPPPLPGAVPEAATEAGDAASSADRPVASPFGATTDDGDVGQGPALHDSSNEAGRSVTPPGGPAERAATPLGGSGVGPGTDPPSSADGHQGSMEHTTGDGMRAATPPSVGGVGEHPTTWSNVPGRAASPPSDVAGRTTPPLSNDPGRAATPPFLGSRVRPGASPAPSSAGSKERPAHPGSSSSTSPSEPRPASADRQRPVPLQEVPNSPERGDAAQAHDTHSSFGGMSKGAKTGASTGDSQAADKSKSNKKQSAASSSSGGFLSTGFKFRRNYLVSKARSPTEARTSGVPASKHYEKMLQGYKNLGHFVTAMRGGDRSAQAAVREELAAQLGVTSGPGEQEEEAPEADALPLEDEAPADMDRQGTPPALTDEPAGDLAMAERPPTAESAHLSVMHMEDVEAAEGGKSLWEQYDAAAELHAAALRNDAGRVRYLLNNPDETLSLQPDLLNEKGETAAVAAAAAGCVASCAALLDGKADAMARDADANVFGDGIWPNELKPDCHGQFVLAAEMSKVWDAARPTPPGRTVIYLLRQNGKFDQVMNRCYPGTRVDIVRSMADELRRIHACSPMVYAGAEGFHDLMRVLCEYVTIHLDRDRPEVDAKTMERNAMMPALRSYVSGFGFKDDWRAPTMEWGLGQKLEDIHWWEKSDFNERGDALLQACLFKNWEAAGVLLKAGVPYLGVNDCKDKLMRSPLHLAALAGETKLVSQLLHAAADISARSSLGRQPIHEAVSGGHLGTTKALIAHGADPLSTVTAAKMSGYAYSRSGDEGRTPHELAAARGHQLVCMHLASRGAAPGDAPRLTKVR